MLRSGRSVRANTALFGGVAKGAEELRKFLAPSRVNRVILLSDGIANVGPSRPSDLAEFGATLRKEGIAVTTLGLGLDYSEDLMSELAREKQAPDFVCLDIMMPGMSGYDVCREIRKKSNLIPVIFISAKGQEVDKVVGLELGADDFIVKPFGVKEVVARVRAVDAKSPRIIQTVHGVGYRSDG